jgi:periplasmic copper chaperone A
MSLLRTFAAVAAACLLSTAGLAHEYKAGALVIHHPWTRATAPGAPVAGGYAEIKNTGTEADRLVSARLEAAGEVEIHSMSMEGDVMKMAELPDGLEIPAGGAVKLAPGGFHMMFLDLKAPLVEGEKVKGVLIFERAGTVEVEFKVEAKGAKGEVMDHAQHSSHGDHAAGGAVAMTGNDAADIEAVMKSIFDKPENPLSVGPIAVEADHAVAGWVQGDMGGRALLRKKDGAWTIHLCSGDSLKDAAILARTGIPDALASKLAAALASAEASADPARVGKFALFEGTVMVGGDAEAKATHGHGTHKHGAADSTAQ